MKIKYKFFLVTLLIVVISLTGFLYFSFDLMMKDKRAYLLEGHRNIYQSLKEHMTSKMESNLLLAQQILNSLENPILRDHVYELLKINSTNFNLTLFYKNKFFLQSHKEKKTMSSPPQNCLELNKKNLYQLKVEKQNDAFFLNGFFRSIDQDYCLITKTKIHNLVTAVKAFRDTNILIYDYDQKNIINISSPDWSKLRNNLAKIQSAVKQASQYAGQRNSKVKFAETIYHLTLSKIYNTKYFVVLLTKEAKIYDSLIDLFLNLFGYFMMITALTLVVALVFSNRLTSPIREFMQTTVEIANGNFNIYLNEKAKDELGLLAKAINHMASEIKKFIGAMKDKLRLEQEVKLASEIQDNFFPYKDLIVQNNLSLFGYYASATECGGDWWGVKTIGHETLIYIGDATGHGTPAAFMTAATFAFYKLTGDESEVRDKDGNIYPSKLLQKLNKLLYEIGGDYFMTFLIVKYDSRDHSLTYSNASHHPPIVMKKDCHHFQDLIYLSESKGFRLGQEKDAVFTDKFYALEKEDKVILFTDGIIEAVNEQGRMFGESRFLRQLVKLKDEDVKSLANGSIEKLNQFTQEKNLDDDITIVTFQRN